MAILVNRLILLSALVLTLSSCAPAGQVPTTTAETAQLGQNGTPPEAEPLETHPSATIGPIVGLRSSLGTDAGEVATSIIALEDGGYLLAGYEYDDANDVAEWDALAMRVDSDGGQVWRHTTGRPGSDYAWVVRPAGTDRFAIVGTLEDDDGTTNGYMQVINAAGDEIWTRSYGGDQNEILWAAEPHPAGGFMLLGQTDSMGQGGLDIYVLRTDDQGQVLWEAAYGTESTDRAFGLDITSDGGGLIAGFTGESSAAMNLFFLRVDSDGRERWRRTIAGDRFDVAHDVLRLADGGFAVSGYSSSYGPGDHDGFLMRLTPGGRMLWMRTYGGDGDDRILHVAEMPDGGFAMIGYSDWDVAIWRVDADGGLMWTHQDGSNLNADVGKDLVVRPDGAIVAVGGTRSDNPPKDDVLLIVLLEDASQ